jgi:hypothetical protein
MGRGTKMSGWRWGWRRRYVDGDRDGDGDVLMETGTVMLVT